MDLGQGGGFHKKNWHTLHQNLQLRGKNGCHIQPALHLTSDAAVSHS